MELLDLKIDVSRSAINRLWKSKLIGGPESTAVVLGMKRRKRKTVRTPEVIGKVKQMVQSDNPRTQLVIGKRVGVRPKRISEIIKEDLGLKRFEKHNAKHLTDDMVAKRKQRAQEFKEKIEGDHLKFILTLDECVLLFDYTNGETEHYYAPKKIEERDRPAPLATSAQQFPEQHMMAAGFCWNCQTELFFIPARTKVNADYFIQHVLKPVFAVDVLRLFGRNAHKVLLHMDSASSHTAQKTINWLNFHGMKFITKDEWLPNSPELAPMDYFVNGHLKQMMRKRMYTTARGMIRAAKEEWSNIPLEMFQNALLAWPERIDLVNKAKGNPVGLFKILSIGVFVVIF